MKTETYSHFGHPRLCVLYLGYRAYESKLDAASLHQQTIAGAVPTVAIVTPKLGPPTETITLPGTVQAWFQAPIYAQVSGYVKIGTRTTARR